MEFPFIKLELLVNAIQLKSREEQQGTKGSVSFFLTFC